MTNQIIRDLWTDAVTERSPSSRQDIIMGQLRTANKRHNRAVLTAVRAAKAATAAAAVATAKPVVKAAA